VCNSEQYSSRNQATLIGCFILPQRFFVLAFVVDSNLRITIAADSQQ
jgi:hypothetical protein